MKFNVTMTTVEVLGKTVNDELIETKTKVLLLPTFKDAAFRAAKYVDKIENGEKHPSDNVVVESIENGYVNTVAVFCCDDDDNNRRRWRADFGSDEYSPYVEFVEFVEYILGGGFSPQG